MTRFHFNYGVLVSSGEKWKCRYTLKDLELGGKDSKGRMWLKCHGGGCFVCNTCKLKEKTNEIL